jgi:hypothetical protein
MNSTAPIRIVEVTGARDLREFLEFPHRLYRDDPHWVPPLHSEIRKLLDRRKNPFFDHGEICLWLAKRGDETVGRISAQINHMHLERHQDATGNFGFLEAIDDQAVFHALLATAEAWVKARGMARILGPYSPSMNDEIGVLIHGFDTPPMVMMAHSPRYYAARLEAEGYGKAKDVNAFVLDMANAMDLDSPRVQRAREKLAARTAVTTRTLDPKHFAEDIRKGLDIYNDAWASNWGFLPVTERDANVLIDSIKPILDPNGVIFGMVDGEMTSIALSVPNLNEIIADLDGKLLPFGWAKLLWRLKWRRPKSARVMLAGVRSVYRDSPISGALMSYSIQALLRYFKRSGIDKIEWSWILEDNNKSAAIQTIGATLSKTYRIYAKPLDAAA